MDFWSRLLAGTSLSPSNNRKVDAAKDPTKRLHRFDKEYNRILQIWRSSSNLANDVDAAETLEIRLQELTNILNDESRRPLPHPCIQYAAKKQVYVPIGKIATTSYNEWIIKEAVLFFATLLETEEEAFVENVNFSASLTNLLVRITGVNSVRLGSDTEAKVVELAFNITTKIRLNRDILHAWFKTNHDGAPKANPQDDQGSFAGRTQRQDFPLFYILMDYIHHEGKVGDFARTGLLYIIESASSDESLEQWIVESDLSTLMATGLGALYSQLSRKLVIDYPTNGLPAILAFSDYERPTSTFEIISSCSGDFQGHIETFLSHLLFWQDVLDHCKSVEVKQTLLEHFQVIFLQQLLYPSLLESSDIDGGSSVAVLTYLRRILESLDHPDMINLILHYLLGLPDHVSTGPSSGGRASISAARKRKSMDLATMLAQTQSDITATPLLFNLVDLIQACLRSHNQQTIRVTLQLVSAIFKRHHRYAVGTLLRTETVIGDKMHRTVGAHEQEVDYLMSLAGSIGGQDNFDEIYENVLKDTMTRLEGHPCSLKLVAPKISTNNHDLPAIPDTLPGAPRDVHEHTLRPDDPMLNTVLDLLETFFMNPVDTNLSLTESILDLAICGYMTVEGWMLRNPQKYTYDEQPPSPTSPDASTTSFRPPTDPDSTTSAEQQTLAALDGCRRRPVWTQSSLPRILIVLQQLCNQVAQYRDTVPRFEDLLQSRREAFQTADNRPTPPPLPPRKPTPQRHRSAHTPERESLDDARSGSPARPSGLERFAQRLVSELSTPTRSGTPRGRKNSRGSGTNSPAPGGLSGGYGLSTPTSRPLPPPKDTPYDHAPRSVTDETGSSHGPRDPVASQAAAFAAIDQSILARKVGIPGKVEAIPLDLGKKPTLHMPPPKDDDEEAEQEVTEEGEQKVEQEGEQEASEAQEAQPEPSGDDTAEVKPKPEEKKAERTASVSHVLTNVIILQSFLFELAALIQVRAGLFNEVRYA
ncbi:hypothetical protein K4K56_006677 [Colletotrichum sp. SAR 10_98]|nr:hypothetical protein K4K56_006677 [Colletotrichum sp. SAR 10_98]